MKCWYNKYHPTIFPCENEGTYQCAIIPSWVWCDEHKHQGDVPLKDSNNKCQGIINGTRGGVNR